MAEGVFSIFPDGQLTSGQGLKGTAPRSKKKALCDVKNTLQSKRMGLQEGPRKINFDAGESSRKQLLKGDPGKIKSKQEGTFTIAVDKENEISWDKCSDCNSLDEGFFDIRPESSRLQKEDIGYLARGFMSFSQDEPKSVLEDVMPTLSIANDSDWFDTEMIIPPFSPLDYECEPILLSDGE